MNRIRLSKSDRKLIGTIQLNGSKSLSNRALIIRSLCDEYFEIDNLSTSDDTTTLEALLSSEQDVFDCHHAGTTFRFMTAYLALKKGSQQLTGSDRMKQRPIGPLVDALNSIGCNITYLGREGFPPLQIDSPSDQLKQEVRLRADISSQFISAILMISPKLSNGLTIHLEGDLVSRPYLQMTLDMMQYFGVSHEWKDEHSLCISSQKYIAKKINIEADWSAASYYYMMAALCDEVDLTLGGLSKDSWQGDSVVAEIAEKLGVQTEFFENEIHLSKIAKAKPKLFEYNFIKVPDIAQSVFVLLAAEGIQGLFSGLQTLLIKETDRIEAMKVELGKFGVFLNKMPPQFSKKSGITYYFLEGKAKEPSMENSILTYKDHRMAMSFAPLAICFPIQIEDAEVVSKSYPLFWTDLQSIGFKIEKI